MYPGNVRSTWPAIEVYDGSHRCLFNALHEQGVPEELQWLLRELFTVVFDGRNCNVMPGVEEALGRPATDFKSYVQKTIESGVWDAERRELA